VAFCCATTELARTVTAASKQINCRMIEKI
jgi:hypothetical protein